MPPVVQPSAHRVASRYLEARAIPLDKSSLRRLVKELTRKLLQAFTRAKPDQPIRNKSVWAEADYETRSVKGEPLNIMVVVRAGKDTRPGPYVDSGGFGKHRNGRPVVILSLNGSYTAAEYLKSLQSPELIEGMLYNILIHEVTHAVDIQDKSTYEVGTAGGTFSTPDLKRYYNDPKEVRAFMQQVVDEVTNGSLIKHIEKLTERFGQNKAVSMLLKNSETWNEAQKYWTPSNRNRVMKSVYQAIT